MGDPKGHEGFFLGKPQPFSFLKEKRLVEYFSCALGKKIFMDGVLNYNVRRE